MSVSFRISAFVFGVVTTAVAVAQPVVEVEDVPPPRETGRYQAFRMNDNIVLVIDTATGDCWSRGLSPSTPWRYEGSPFREVRPASERVREARAPVLTLREGDAVEVTVRQRGRTALPTSNGTLSVSIGDITEGQTLVSLRDEAGKPVVRERSLRQGDALLFEIDDRPYELRAVDLRNLLTGDDFAVFLLQNARPNAPNDVPRTAPADPPTLTPPADDARE